MLKSTFILHVWIQVIAILMVIYPKIHEIWIDMFPCTFEYSRPEREGIGLAICRATASSFRQQTSSYSKPLVEPYHRLTLCIKVRLCPLCEVFIVFYCFWVERNKARIRWEQIQSNWF